MFLTGIGFMSDRFPVQDVFPFNIKAFQTTGHIELTSRICFFSGENGVGKSALLDSIARKCGYLPWGGTKTHRVHSNPYESQLAKFVRLDFAVKPKYGFHFRAEAFFNFASSLDDIIVDDPDRIGYFGGQSLNAQSHGESFLSFFKSYSCGIDGLYLIDEPESALSPKSQVEFVRVLLSNVSSSNKQYLIATLSPIILACPGAQIFSFDGSEIKAIPFRDTQVFKLYKNFMDDPEGFFSLQGKC